MARKIKSYWLLVFSIFSAHLWTNSRGLLRTWQWGHDGFNGSAFSQAARNSLRFGISAQAQYYTGITPPPVEELYTHHPLMLHAHLVAAYHFLGDYIWIGRLIPFIYSSLIFVMIFAITWHWWGRIAALVASTIWAVTPLTIVYANMINHEVGGIFWSLAMIASSFRYFESQKKKWFFASLISATICVQFDWPGYYIAFFLAIHAIGYAFTHALKQQLVWILSFSFVILANFFGFFLWIRLSIGNLQGMEHALITRMGMNKNFFSTIWIHLLDLHGQIMLLSTAIWLIWLIHRITQKKNKHTDFLPLFFIVAQIIHTFAFKNAGFLHAYWTYWLVPGTAIGTGILAHELSEASKLRFPNNKHLIELFSIIGSILICIHIMNKMPVIEIGHQRGGAIYVAKYYNSFHLQQWAASLNYHFPVSRTQNEEHSTTFLIHYQLETRSEFRSILDAPYREIHSVLENNYTENNSVLIADLTRLTNAEQQRIIALTTQYRTILWDRHLIAINLADQRRLLTSYLREQQEISPLERHLRAPEGRWIWQIDNDLEGAYEAIRARRWIRTIDWIERTHSNNEKLFIRSCRINEAIVGIASGSDSSNQNIRWIEPICRHIDSSTFSSLPIAQAGLHSFRNIEFCSNNSISVGLRGVLNENFHQISPICRSLSELNQNIEFENNNNEFVLHCRTNEFLVGISGKENKFLNQLSIQCIPFSEEIM